MNDAVPQPGPRQTIAVGALFFLDRHLEVARPAALREGTHCQPPASPTLKLCSRRAPNNPPFDVSQLDALERRVAAAIDIPVLLALRGEIRAS